MNSCLARLALIAAAARAPLAHAETTQDEQAWINLTAMGPISGDVVYFAEFQPRMGDGISRLDALLLRGAVGVKLSRSATLYQG
ncbi:DUF2490 domain-containing protein, partial [Novosphingobium resinovorum]|uniref:DUF2490 domain-containing protein n=1 Tax=Novosphingobium resinovorum TaxID=158500 RepID=UPI00360B456C